MPAAGLWALWRCLFPLPRSGGQRDYCCGHTHASPGLEICASQVGMVQSCGSPSQHKPTLTLPLCSSHHLEASLFPTLQGTEGIPEGRDPVPAGGSVLQHGAIRRSAAGLQGSGSAAAFKQGHPTGTGERGARAGPRHGSSSHWVQPSV